MKVLITGTSHGLGKTLKELLMLNGYEIGELNSIDALSHQLTDIVNEFDVFINNKYSNTLQSDLFEYVFNKWKYEKKTIVNILSSALIFDGPNKQYIEDKRHLENKTFQLRTFDKEVRIINVYPNTLESSYSVNNQKLKFSEVCSIINWVINLPHDIEIFEIGISKTKLKIENTLL
jgi:hypothetical protein